MGTSCFRASNSFANHALTRYDLSPHLHGLLPYSRYSIYWNICKSSIKGFFPFRKGLFDSLGSMAPFTAWQDFFKMKLITIENIIYRVTEKQWLEIAQVRAVGHDGLLFEFLEQNKHRYKEVGPIEFSFRY